MIPDIANVMTTQQVACVTHNSMQSVGGIDMRCICSLGALLPAQYQWVCKASNRKNVIAQHPPIRKASKMQEFDCILHISS